MGADLDYLRTEMLSWANALSAHDAGDFRGALRLFEPISDTTKILMNMGFVYEQLGERAEAIEKFTKAIDLDKYLAIGYFQRGVAYFSSGQFAEAVQDFSESEKMMRSNDEINYSALGLDYRLALPNILFNKWLALSRLGRTADSAAVLKTLTAAAAANPYKNKLQSLIDQALVDPETCSPCSTPAGTLYRPSLGRLQFLTAAAKDSTMDALPPPPAYHAPAAGAPNRSNTTSTDTTYVGRQKHKRKLSAASSIDGRGGAPPRVVADHVPTHAELTRAVGPDFSSPQGTEILGIPCAGVRIAHGALKGLMAWRLVVGRRSRRNSSEDSGPRVLVNFILDTGREASYVPRGALEALGWKDGDAAPGTSVSLIIQGIKTSCVVAKEGEAGRVGTGFMTAGSLTYYFDAGLVAPVLYDGSGDRPTTAPRTIWLPQRSNTSLSLLNKILILIGFGRRRR